MKPVYLSSVTVVVAVCQYWSGILQSDHTYVQPTYKSLFMSKTVAFCPVSILVFVVAIVTVGVNYSILSTIPVKLLLQHQYFIQLHSEQLFSCLLMSVLYLVIATNNGVYSLY